MYYRKFLISSTLMSLIFSGALLANNSFDYDPCSAILRDGVRDVLASSNSKTYSLVKHNQFCSIAKKHSLSRNSFHQFAKHYSENVKESRGGMDAGASVEYGPFSFDGEYGQSHESSSLNREDRENILIRNQEQILDYFENNCGDSSFQEHLEMEAQSTSKIANPAIVDAWKQCMVKKHGVFVYAEGDTYSENFSIRVDWFNNGNNFLKEVYLQWHGNNIDTGCPSEIIEGSDFRQTHNICSDGKFIFSGGNRVIAIHRRSNVKSDMVYVTARADNGYSQAFSIALPKFIELKKIKSPSVCERRRLNALRLHLISNIELQELRDANEAPIIVGNDEIIAWVSCTSVNERS